MIDKITPRPSEQIADDLEALGVEKMQPVITGKKTYIAPFVNAENRNIWSLKTVFRTDARHWKKDLEFIWRTEIQ